MPKPTGAQRLTKSLGSLGRIAVQPKGMPALLTVEWAETVETRLRTVERQLKLLNATLLTSLVADIIIRLVVKG